mgnify:CR=1 FL=1
MAKVKVKQLPVDWVENTKGELIGEIADIGVSTNTLIDELINIPIDVPTLKSRDVTTSVLLKFPKTFADDRKNNLLTEAQKLYPNWKAELTNEGLHIRPSFDSEQPV